ncbi:hypothetical protein JTB14_022774 [Gonioctena quinquepunctata]|nr:hypothetical protein JTB14_022774 [Gonioctena quinquepunctata]
MPPVFLACYMDTLRNNVEGIKWSNCADTHEMEEEYSNCMNIKCFYCGLGHKSNDKTCKEYERQKLMRKKMSLDNVPFKEAAQYFPKSKKISTQHDRKFPRLGKNEQVNVENISLNGSYAHATRVKPDNINDQRTGYDKEKNDGCSFHKNGRVPQSSNGVTNIFNIGVEDDECKRSSNETEMSGIYSVGQNKGANAKYRNYQSNGKKSSQDTQ